MAIMGSRVFSRSEMAGLGYKGARKRGAKWHHCLRVAFAAWRMGPFRVNLTAV